MWVGADYEITDPGPIALSAPYTFFRPAPEEISAIGPGDLIQATIRSNPPSLKWDAERLWFTVLSVSDDQFEARLESEPYDMPSFPKGRIIEVPRQAIVGLVFADERPRIPEPRQYWERCFVDGSVLEGTRRIAYLYREDPETSTGDTFPDSGWRVRASTAGQSALEAEKEAVQYVALGAVLNKDDSWLRLLDSPVGSSFRRDFETGIWIAEPFTPRVRGFRAFLTRLFSK